MKVKKLSPLEFGLLAVQKELELIGLDISVTHSDPQWFHNNTMTMAQHQEWKEWFITEARKTFKMSKKFAEKEFSYFSLRWGLRISDFPSIETQSDSSSK